MAANAVEASLWVGPVEASKNSRLAISDVAKFEVKVPTDSNSGLNHVLCRR
jgi:hypothetical protein